MKQWLGLPVCVGVGPTKTLAKLANHIAKKRPEFEGVCVFDALPADQQSQLLESIPVNEVWGIGHRLTEHLGKLGVATVADLQAADPNTLRRNFSVVVERTVMECAACRVSAWKRWRPRGKQIISSRSFGRPVTELSELTEAAASYATRAAEKLRRQDCVASFMQVFMHTNPFKPGEPVHNPCISLALTDATNDTRTLARYAVHGVRRAYRRGFRYVKAGVVLDEITSGQNRQRSFFLSEDVIEKSAKLMQTLDRLNRSMGAKLSRSLQLESSRDGR